VRFSPEASAVQTWDKTFAALARDTESKGRTAVVLSRKHRDARGELQFGQEDRVSSRWRLARGALLSASRAGRWVPSLVVAATTLRERLGGPGLDVWYRFALDYFYWLGVNGTLADDDRPAARA
jgi:hypothetical protein